jgi:hypothetical protein
MRLMPQINVRGSFNNGWSGKEIGIYVTMHARPLTWQILLVCL